jgi:hypothetical protein
LAELLDGTLVAERAAALEGRRFDAQVHGHVLWLAEQIAGKPLAFAAVNPTTLLREVALEWHRQSDAFAKNRPEELTRWMEVRIDQLEKSVD